MIMSGGHYASCRIVSRVGALRLAGFYSLCRKASAGMGGRHAPLLTVIHTARKGQQAGCCVNISKRRKDH